MKIYFSGGFNYKGKANLMIKHLKKLGHEITFDWSVEPFLDKNVEHFSIGSEKVYQAIKECDILICVFFDNKERQRGIFTEIGIAIGMNKKVLVLNDKHTDNLTWISSDRIETTTYYHFKPYVKIFKMWNDIINEINEMSKLDKESNQEIK